MFRPIQIIKTKTPINRSINNSIILRNFPNNLLITPIPINKFSEIKNYLNNIYKYSNIGICGTLITSIICGNMGSIISLVFNSTLPLTILCGFGSGANIYTYIKLKETPYNYYNKEIITEEKRDWFTLYYMTLGIGYSPLVATSLSIHSMIIPTIVITIMGSYMGASKIALPMCKSITDIKKITPMVGTISGIISAILLHGFSSYMGFTNLGNLIDIGTMAVTATACYGFLTYDYMRAIKDYKDNKIDSIKSSIKYFNWFN